MKAITLWQPWASAMALGAKRIETRHWPTNVRGPVAIHAAKRCVRRELDEYSYTPLWLAALEISLVGDDLTTLLPFGAIVAVGNLVDCRPTESFSSSEIETIRRRPDTHPLPRERWCERDMGNYGPGRFGWVFEEMRPLAEPVPFKGAQGFFNVPDELLNAADGL